MPVEVANESRPSEVPRYQGWKRNEMCEECRRRGLPVAGGKDELRERLERSDAAGYAAIAPVAPALQNEDADIEMESSSRIESNSDEGDEEDDDDDDDHHDRDGDMELNDMDDDVDDQDDDDNDQQQASSTG
jgi:hypothetical protein